MLRTQSLFLIICCWVLLSSAVYAQDLGLYFHFGHDAFRQNLVSPTVMNGISIVPTAENTGEPLYGVGFRYSLNTKLAFRLESNLGRALYAYTVADLDESCTFCPIRKGVGGGGTRFDLSLLADYNLYQTEKSALSLTLGLSSSKYVNVEKREFNFNGQHQRTARAMEEITASFDHESVLFSNIGVSFLYKRYKISLLTYQQLSTSTSSNLLLDGVSYPFTNKVNITYLTIGYLLPFKRKSYSPQHESIHQ